jgi:hypothetical protein
VSSTNKKINSKIVKRIAAILSTALAVAIVASGTWSAQAATLGQTQGQRAGNPPTSPDATCPAGGQCFADVPAGNPFYEFVNRIYEQDLVAGYACGGAGEPCDQYNRPYYRPGTSVTRQQMAKYIDNARHLSGIDISVTGGDPPIRAGNDTGSAITAFSTSGQALTAQSSTQVAIYAQTGDAPAISGYSTGGNHGVGVAGDGNVGVSGNGNIGVRATGNLGVWAEGGVYAHSATAYGVQGISTSSDGVLGESDTGIAVYGWNHSTPAGWAGWFVGNVRINGNCCGMSEGYTQIDDPLDPANKYLNQSLVQSPDMTSVINDNVTLDSKGEATVSLPAWFEVANQDFRYSLTAVGAPGPNLYIAQELSGNEFRIAGGEPGAKVSWQVTGIRQDAYAKAYPIEVEQDKSGNEQGKYLNPELYGQPGSEKILGDK